MVITVCGCIYSAQLLLQPDLMDATELRRMRAKPGNDVATLARIQLIKYRPAATQ